MSLTTLRQDARDTLGNVTLLNKFDEAERLAERGDIDELSNLLDELANDFRRRGLDNLANELSGLEDQFRFGNAGEA